VTSSGFRPVRSIGTAPTPTTAMIQIAVQEQLDGKAVDWMEQVREEQYQA
jgi:hypothetical protein